MTRPGIEPHSNGPLANTLLIRPIDSVNSNNKDNNHNNSWAVLLVRYSGPFLKWIREEHK